jgi:hypothetical protein
MHSMQADAREKDKIGWERLRTNLQVSENTLRSIQQHADWPRHGKPWALTDGQRADIFKISDEIIRRYFEYLVRGRVALPENEFPVLKDEVRPR